MKKKRIAVGLSGGVDSSLVLNLLKNQGYDVIGLTMEIYDGAIKVKEGGKHACYGPGEADDIKAAGDLCKSLDVPYYVIDLKEEYNKAVLEYTRNEYINGRTPNPCVVCNNLLKFGFLIDKARDCGIQFDYFATGHYAQIVHSEEKDFYQLKQAVDTKKDQTYFICRLTSDRISQLMFPLGTLTKPEVRKMALDLNLEVAEKPESQDFIAGGDYSVLFKKEDSIPGFVLNRKGEMLGEHKGIIHYTIGQRRGLGITAPDPMYITNINAKKNTITVGPVSELTLKEAIVGDIIFNAPLPEVDGTKMNVRIRHQHAATPAMIHLLEDGKFKVIFDDPQLSVTPGQTAVFYLDDIVLGGGVIE